jgi:aryl-alcohol dehydrogenase-like predicted oxidoreductase
VTRLRAVVKRKVLPHTDLEVSEVCLGTMTWGEQNSEADAHAQLDFAVAHGVNFIDTAEMYPAPPSARTQGRTESYLGSWLCRQPRRQDLVIATKVAGPGRRDWIRGGRTDLDAATIVEAADTSLARLRLDHIDLFQIHWPQRNVPLFGQLAFDPAHEKSPGGPSIHEQVEGMAALLRAGKIRHWGLSNETCWGVCEFHRAARELGVAGPVTLQNSYSLVSRGAEGDIAEALFRERMSLLAYSPLAGGLLSGKYLGGVRPEGARFTVFDSLGARFKKAIVGEAIEAWVALAQRHGLTPVQLALGYVRTRWFVGAQIIGATSVAQLAENLAAVDTELDADTTADIDRLLARYPNPAN